MRFKFTAIIAIAFIFLLSPSVEAKNIFKAGSDIAVEEGQAVNNIVCSRRSDHG